jgi:hypothetical protein
MGSRISALDVAAGAGGRAAWMAEGLARRIRPVVEPPARTALHPPFVPARLQPARWLAGVAREGAQQRALLRARLGGWLDVLVPVLLEEVLRRAHVTELLLRYVDLDEVVAAADLDAAAAALDVDKVVRRVDLDEVVRRVDVDAIVKRVDVDSVVSRVDVDSVVDRVDVDAVVNRVDLTSVVLQRVDLDVLVDAVLDRIDLIKLAEEVIDGVDLPEIIRESTGSMASDTVRGVRMQGIVADEAVGRAVDRFLLRRGRRSTKAPANGPSVDLQDEPTIPEQHDPRR